MLTQAPRGTKDVLPQDSWKWQAVEAVMREIAARAGFREVRTPVFEHTELFCGAWATPPTSCKRKCTPSRTRAIAR